MYVALSTKRKWLFGKNKMKIILEQDDLIDAVKDWVKKKGLNIPVSNDSIELYETDDSEINASIQE